MGGCAIEAKRKISVIECADVVVCGGGPAGLCAALASAYEGARTVLIERYGFLGGNLAGTNLEAVMTFHDHTGRKIIDGIPQLLVDALIDAAGSLGHVEDNLGYCETLTPVDPEILKHVALHLVREAGISLYLHSWICGVLMDQNRIEGVVIDSKSGRFAIRGSVVIDATGDADVAAWAGVPFEKCTPPNGCQPMSLMFRLGGVNIRKVIEYVCQHRDEFRTLKCSVEELASKPILHLWGWSGFLSRGYLSGRLSFKRNEMILITTMRPGEVIINLTRSFGDGTKVEDLTRAELETRTQLMEFLSYARSELPGFKGSYLISTGTHVGVRETRRIIGEYQLTLGDVVSGARFQDVVAKSAFPIDIHQADGPGMITQQIQEAYDIPYRCLVPVEVEGLLVAGRCISTTHEALASARISATCMALGPVSYTHLTLPTKA